MSLVSTPRTSRQEARSAESQAAILNAAIQVIAERGCAGATISRIAGAAGLSTAAVFWHFKDKSGLLRAVAMQIKMTWVARVKADALTEATGRARLERLTENHLAWVGAEDAMMRTFVLLGLEAHGLGETAAGEFVGELSRLYRGVVAQIIREGQEDGSLGTGAPPESAALVLTSALMGTLIQRATTGETMRAGDLSRAVIDGLLGRTSLS